MIFFATLHGAGTFFIWGIKNRIQDEVISNHHESVMLVDRLVWTSLQQAVQVVTKYLWRNTFNKMYNFSNET